MNRRHFLRNGSLAGLSIPALALAASADAFPLTGSTITGLQQKLHRGAYTARSLTEAYLRRIHDIDREGPALRAVIELNPDATGIADALDKERKAGKIRGPLQGIPILIKDNIDTGDKMKTTAGALALQDNIAAEDAFIVRRLREAGAVLLGKTNLSEWANFRSERSTSGWSSRGGQTRSPYFLDRNPSGSSAGSAVAVAADLCAIAIGTETNGSIVSPGSVNGLVGIKPTVGLWSRSGIIPISATQDTAGPMARTVKDAAILLGALAGEDPRDPVTTGSKAADYTLLLHPAGLRGKRIGLEKAFLRGPEGVVALYKRAADLLRRQGAELVEVDLVKSIDDLGRAEFTVLQYEFRDGVNRYLAGSRAKMRSLSDVIAYNKANAPEAMPFFQQETLESSNQKGGLDSPEYREALTRTTGARGIIDGLLHDHKLDAVCGVTNGPACCIDLVSGDYDTGFSFSSPAALAGYPHITVPMGLVHGLPIGFSFMGGAFSEGPLLGMAYAFEQAMPARVPPRFLPAVMPGQI